MNHIKTFEPIVKYQFSKLLNETTTVFDDDTRLFNAMRANFVKQSCLSRNNLAPLSFLTLEDADSVFDTPAKCLSDTTCNWMFAPVIQNDYIVGGDIAGIPFTLDPCITPPAPMNNTGDHFCGRCRDVNDPDSLCEVVSTNGECFLGTEYSLFEDPSWCADYNGEYFLFRVSCIKPASDVSNCLDDRYCPMEERSVWHDVPDGYDAYITRTITCEGGCFWEGDPAYNTTINQTACLALNQYSIYSSWSTHTINNITYTRCQLPGIYSDHCPKYMSDAAKSAILNSIVNNTLVKFWPGATYVPPKKNNVSSCVPECRYNTSITTKDECVNNYHCSNPLCLDCTQSQCENSGLCDVVPGCYLKTDDGDCSKYSGVDTTLFPELAGLAWSWFPTGCRSFLVHRLNAPTCKSVATFFNTSYFFLDYPTWSKLDKAGCESLGWTYCYQKKLFYSAAINQQAPYLTAVNDIANCSVCNGTLSKLNNWVPGKWISSSDQWIEYEWKQRKYVQANNWTESFDDAKFTEYITTAFLTRQAELLKGALICKEAAAKESLLQSSCLCGDDGTDTEVCKNSRKTNQLIGVSKACSGIQFNYNYPTFGTIRVNKEFFITDFECIDINIYNLAQELFKSKSRISLSSKFPIPVSQSNRGDFRYVKNENGVIVGDIVSNGIRFVLTAPAGVTGPYGNITTCINLPTAEPEAGYYYYLATADDLLEKLTPYEGNVTRSSNSPQQICFMLSSDITVFPVKLLSDYKDLSWISTFSSPELGMLSFGLFLYSIAIIAGSYFLYEHIERRTFNLMRGATEILSTLIISTARIIFFALLLGGVQVEAEVVAILLTEIPAITVYTVLAVIVSKMAHVYRGQKKLRRNDKTVNNVLLGFVVFMASCLLLTIILVGGIPRQNVQTDCFSPLTRETLSGGEVVVIIYFIIFLTGGLLLIAAFLFYCQRLTEKIIRAKASGAEKKRKFVRNLIVLSTSSSLNLLAQCFYIIVQVIPSWNWSPVAVSSFLIVIDSHALAMCLYFAHESSEKGKGGTSVSTRSKTSHLSAVRQAERTGSIKDTIDSSKTETRRSMSE
eukprot:TRINITY_DN813_c0_g1_i5.p1 TRINITY_DN813_c0_g1~~TRINITY_DN813_c0_g1_i5.p1  ORF type:complete len:1069 (+),score=178.26 TRINITY_DN813_c0_g1_i5:3503-6709(+)